MRGFGWKFPFFSFFIQKIPRGLLSQVSSLFKEEFYLLDCFL